MNGKTKKEEKPKLPKTKIVFAFDYNGFLIGKATADLDQKDKTSYIMPAHSTDIEPLKRKKGFNQKFNGNEWVYEKIVIKEKPVEPEYVPTYADKRRVEYPSIYEYVDGVVKGDEAQVQKYVDDCLAVKAKYPKPE